MLSPPEGRESDAPKEKPQWQACARTSIDGALPLRRISGCLWGNDDFGLINAVLELPIWAIA